jgi:phage tail sheath protein FI
MTALLHPGVFVQEVPSGVRSIEGVPTSTTIFVGETERGPVAPTKILNAGDYARLFGSQLRHSGSSGGAVRVAMRYEVDLFFQNGGNTAYVLRVLASAPGSPPNTTGLPPIGGRSPFLVASSPGQWGNHVFAVITLSPSTPVTSPPNASPRFRVTVYYQSPGAAPQFVEDFDRLTTINTDENFVVDVLSRSLYVRWLVDPVNGPAAAPTTFDSWPTSHKVTELTVSDLANITNTGTGATTNVAQFTTPSSNLDTTADDTTVGLALPALDGIDDAAIIVGATEKWVAGTAFATGAVQTYYGEFQSYVDNRPKQDLFFIGDVPSFSNDVSGTAATADVVTHVNTINHSTFVGLYWPHLVIADPVGATATSTITVPPSGAVAGIFSRIDNSRGVWKAPAGVEATVNGLTRMGFDIIDQQQDSLNPIGVNVVRLIPGAGTVVWGSRTTRPDSEWRYVPVRRTAMFLRKSIFNGIQFAVFEPNDTALWATLRATIGAFMETQFRNGAFAGTTTNDAFFVKVDSETTTPADQAAGIVNILVGFAPLRPAEFVVVKLSQKTATAA